jgi:ribosomal protein S27E
MRGWVYIITNKAMPSLVKIGFSTKDPIIRAEELNHTGSPHSYEVAYDALIMHPQQIEQQVHKLLEEKREGKEWFKCTIGDAIAAIKKIAAGGVIIEKYHLKIDPKTLSDSYERSEYLLDKKKQREVAAKNTHFSCPSCKKVSLLYPGSRYIVTCPNCEMSHSILGNSFSPSIM